MRQRWGALCASVAARGGSVVAAMPPKTCLRQLDSAFLRRRAACLEDALRELAGAAAASGLAPAQVARRLLAEPS